MSVEVAAGVVSTEAGRALAEAVSATVRGSALLSAADAEADEGTALEFAVTFGRAAAAAVTVDCASANGTATAGTDYEGAFGTLAFAAGEREKTVSVVALSDAAEEEETFLAHALERVGGRGRGRRGHGLRWSTADADGGV